MEIYGKIRLRPDLYFAQASLKEMANDLNTRQYSGIPETATKLYYEVGIEFRRDVIYFMARKNQDVSEGSKNVVVAP